MNPQVEAFITWPVPLPSIPLWLVTAILAVLLIRARAGK